jgi:hypothetical protein
VWVSGPHRPLVWVSRALSRVLRRDSVSHGGNYVGIWSAGRVTEHSTSAGTSEDSVPREFPVVKGRCFVRFLVAQARCGYRAVVWVSGPTRADEPSAALRGSVVLRRGYLVPRVWVCGPHPWVSGPQPADFQSRCVGIWSETWVSGPLH